jgi:hypothetical protein
METKETFYQASGNAIAYKQIEFHQDMVVLKSGIRGGNQEIEKKQFPDDEAALDFYMERRKQYRQEAKDNRYTGAGEIKISIDLTKQQKTLTQDEFQELLQTISHAVEEYIYDTVNGEMGRDIKKVKGTLYSISVHLIDKEPALQEIISKLRVLTNKADLTVTEGGDKVFTQIPAFTGAKDLEVEFWTENYGFIFFTLTLGEQTFESRFSDVWDPTRDLRAWLESITTGVEECAFMIQNEGEDTKFNLHNWGNRALFFMGWDRDNMNMVEYVNRHQFVKALYTGYLNFFNPDTFSDKKNWDENNAELFKSKIIEEYLAEGK